MLAVSIYYVQRLEDAQSFIKVLFLHVRWLSHLTPILTNVHHPGLVLNSWIGWYYMQRNVAFSMATSDKPSDKVGGLTNRLIMVNGLIMVENERKKRGKRESSCPHKLEHFMQMLSKRREDTWKLLGGSCIFCIFYLNTVLVYWLVYICISHPPTSQPLVTHHPCCWCILSLIVTSQLLVCQAGSRYRQMFWVLRSLRPWNF